MKLLEKLKRVAGFFREETYIVNGDIDSVASALMGDEFSDFGDRPVNAEVTTNPLSEDYRIIRFWVYVNYAKSAKGCLIVVNLNRLKLNQVKLVIESRLNLYPIIIGIVGLILTASLIYYTLQRSGLRPDSSEKLNIIGYSAGGIFLLVLTYAIIRFHLKLRERVLDELKVRLATFKVSPAS